MPNPINPPAACNFHPRCPRFVEGVCDVDEPTLRRFGRDHEAACHYPLEHWPMSLEEFRRPAQVSSASMAAAGPASEAE